jgi:acyl-CoA synthetase (AMP-forming)/AMP-acid ligase II
VTISYLTQGLHRARIQFPERTASVFGARRRSYGEFVDRVSRLAGGLRQLGVQPGDRVGVLSLNSDRYLELYYAIWWAGGIINPVNTRWSPREIAYALDDCQTSVLAVDDGFAGLAEELSSRAQSLRTLIHAGEAEASSGMFSYEQLIADNLPATDALRANDDLAGIFYTGGTTGIAKGVMLSHRNLWSVAGGSLEHLAPPGQTALHAAPMFHLADGMFLLGQTLRGNTQMILPAFEPGAVIQAIAGEKVGTTLLVPTMIQMVVDHPSLTTTDLSPLRRILYGASAISEALLDRAMARLPEVEFLQAYGLTEMSPMISVLGPEQHRASGRAGGRLRSAGQPTWFVDVRILNAEGEDAPRGSVGEVVARGPGVMQGYWGKPQETEAALRDGWLHTGDGGYLDQEGYLFIVDRVKDMIVSGGENVYSAEVENAVAQHPAVAACAVIGIPDPHWGEAVHAVIVCRPGLTAPSAEDLRQHCRELIAGYKCPRSVEVRKDLPLSGAGKVLKTVLREPYWRDQQRRVG